MGKFVLLSPAKLNLYLKVLNRREDGYHNINSLVQKISLFDTIYIEIFNNPSFKKIKFSIEVPENNNTISKAIELFEYNSNLTFGYNIYVEKNIPTESGLGGGSSNAAVVLKFLNNYFKKGFTTSQLIEMGKKIGADVPLFIENASSVLMYGIGDKIKVLDKQVSPYKWFLLIKPEISLSTKKVYKQLKLVLTKFNKSIMEESLFEIGFNDLEKSAFNIYPELKDIKNLLKNFSELSLMTGSGSVIFAGFKNKKVLLEVFDKVKKNFNKYKIYICRSL